jgi:hypothetical protein
MIKYSLLLFIIISASCNSELTKCEQIQEWKIENYKIIKSKCLGPAGPPYYPLGIYKGTKFFGDIGFQKDDCTITFQATSDLYSIFDICKNQLTEIKPDKKLIELSTVDSIQIFSKDLNQNKRLSQDLVDKFIKDWNKSKPSDYRDKPVDSVFYPSYQYRLTVYSKSATTEFLGLNFLVSNKTKWTYYIDDSEDVDYFTKLWAK